MKKMTLMPVANLLWQENPPILCLHTKICKLHTVRSLQVLVGCYYMPAHFPKGNTSRHYIIAYYIA